MEIKKQLEETDDEILTLAITELRQRFGATSNHLYLPFALDLPDSYRITIPKQGDKKKLIDFSLHNAKMFRQEKFKQMKIVDPDRRETSDAADENRSQTARRTQTYRVL